MANIVLVGVGRYRGLRVSRESSRIWDYVWIMPEVESCGRVKFPVNRLSHASVERRRKTMIYDDDDDDSICLWAKNVIHCKLPESLTSLDSKEFLLNSNNFLTELRP